MKDEYIDLALNEAKEAFYLNEVPVGAVIVQNDSVLAKAHNLKKKTNIVMNHAEILAIIDACKKNGDWRLNDCDMYVTLEPCPMCAGALVQSRIRKLYIGTESNNKSNKKIIKQILQNNEYNHYVEIEYLNNVDCSNILSTFFVDRR